ncbi:E3 ubiquitin-protein ligase HOS1 [Camellia lanceoleosa]|uniref:E3 ubiquitin-protein ligase HOS1 n=1 Tax=Camellia lanceoleosa TaxID=1840588 RepID=A0ACC0HYV8_9ERIC|nr:E3 ubiquitin-protein ligase HOS1 [Camellia lanceoleosa]
MKMSLSSLLKFSVKLSGISNLLEVLDSSFKVTLSAQFHDLYHLQESILKTKQHMEIMMWCIRHHFLENVGFQYTNFTSWRSSIRERKLAAIKRSWHDSVNHFVEFARTNGSTLFIEDALLNIEIEQGYTHEIGGELEIASLQKAGGSLFFKSKIKGMTRCYPYENLRAAADILFLHGSSDLVIAKQALHWTRPEEECRHIIDDFAATFNITRHFLLESFTFYLLDDHTDDTLQEACRLLPEISGPTTHPKVAQVLLEKKIPDAALMVLRWCGHDGGARLVSLEFPWNSIEEKYLHRSLLDFVVDDSVEQDLISKDSVSEVVISRMRSASHWTAGLVVQEPNLTSLLVLTSIYSFHVLWMGKTFTFSKPLVLETPSKLGGYANNSKFEIGNHGSLSILQGSFSTNAERIPKPQSGVSKIFKFEDIRTPGIHCVRPIIATPFKEFNKSSSRVPQNSSFQDYRFDQAPSNGPHRLWKAVPSDDPMDVSWSNLNFNLYVVLLRFSHGETGTLGDGNVNGGPRWRSDDSDEDEELQSPNRLA